jgi:hypothetical protein
LTTFSTPESAFTLLLILLLDFDYAVFKVLYWFL